MAAIERADSTEGMRKAVAFIFGSPAIQHFQYEFRTSSDIDGRPRWKHNRVPSYVDPPSTSTAEIFDHVVPMYWKAETAFGYFIPFRGRLGSTSLVSFGCQDIDGWAPDVIRYAERLLFIVANLHRKIHALTTQRSEIALTEREAECLSLVYADNRIHEIARQLQLSDTTVNQYLTRARIKLNASTSAQAAIRAVELDLLARKPTDGGRLQHAG